MAAVRRIILAVAGCWLLSAAGALAQTTTQTTTQSTTQSTTRAASQPAEVTRLIAQLTGDTWKERQAAQDSLVLIGCDAVAPLQAALDHATDDELRTRAAAALRSIEENRVVGPSIITLHLHEVPPARAFAELAAQAQCPLPTFPPQLWDQQVWPPVSIDVERQPFWTAMQSLAAQTGVQLQPINPMGEARLYLIRGGGNWMLGPSQLSGPFLVVARNISRSSTVDLAQPQNVQRNFYISFMLVPEPKLRILQPANELKVLEAADDKGNSLVAPAGWRNGGMFGGGMSFPYTLYGQLTYPGANAGHSIAMFKASTHFVIQARSQKIEVADILNVQNLTKTVGDRRFTIRDVRVNSPGNYTVDTVVYRDNMSPQEWQIFRTNSAPIELLDAQSRRLMSNGAGSSGTDREIQCSIQFSNQSFDGQQMQHTGDPVKLVWEVPLEIRDVEVPFEFHGLPMPD